MLCSKWFICTSPDKQSKKCSTKEALVRKVQQEKMLFCYQYNWAAQNEHVREYNWDNLGMPF